MENQDSSKRISIIALIIAIIALLINLWMLYGYWNWLKLQKAAEPVQQEQVVEPVAQEPAQAEPVAEEVEEPHPQVPADQPLKKKVSGAAYVDLGLPSGIKWRSANEPDLMTYDDAVAEFGKKLPTHKQYTELLEKCQWKELKSGGYKVVGPNGNSIIFPVSGFINCTGELRGTDNIGDYWTATTNGTDEAYRMVFTDKQGPKLVLHQRCYARAIRLIEK